MRPPGFRRFSVHVSKTEERPYDIHRLRPSPQFEILSAPNSAVKVFLLPFRTTEEVESRNKRFNNEFSLRFYLPKSSPEKPVDRLFILLNGFAEGTTDFWDSMAGSFASAGIASVLMPLPDHFCRNIFYNLNSYIESDPFQLQETEEINLKLFTQIMKRELLANPDRFIRFNRQLMGEIRKLLDYVDEPAFSDSTFQEFFSAHFSRELTVSILGYSLGGLCALQAFLLQPERFWSCILLNSGASFQDMDGSEMFGRVEWRDHQRTLTRAGREHRQEADQNYFDHVMLGNSKKELQEMLRVQCHRILVLLGGTDSIINLRKLANLEPEESGLAIVQIPGLEHHINIKKRAGSVWDKWRRFAADAILSFDKNHPSEVVLSEAETEEAQAKLEW